jgi:heme/copper-type cytochrome/quinol oxidase subunit 4
MKKKQGSLLDQLKQENLANSNSSKALAEFENEIKNLKSNTVLIEKVNLIKQLQKLNTLESSNKIFSILNEKFDYAYPFYFTYNSDGLPKLDNLTIGNNLKNHIVFESKYNSLKKEFENILGLNQKIKTLTEKKNNSSGFYGAGCGVSAVLMIILVIINMFGDTGGSVQATTFYIVCGIPILYIIISLIKFLEIQTTKSEIIKTEKDLQNKISNIKTKANN